MLKANGIEMAGMDLQDAAEVVAVLVATGRAVPSDRWVDELREEAQLSALGGLI